MDCRTAALAASCEAIFSRMTSGVFDIVRLLLGVPIYLTTDHTEFTDGRQDV
jgi:hypothetical protein